jgi:hypothetical protein
LIGYENATEDDDWAGYVALDAEAKRLAEARRKA